MEQRPWQKSKRGFACGKKYCHRSTEALRSKFELYFFCVSVATLSPVGAKKSRPEESGRDVFKHEKNLQSLFFPVFRREAGPNGP